MSTAIVSDLHLGSMLGTDLARDEAVRRVLLEEIGGAERVVLLGDTLELRDLPPPRILERAAPFFADLGEALGEVEVVIVPGNHDHGLARTLLERTPGLGLEQRIPAAELPETAAIASLAPGCEVSLAYPGLRLREDVYATHGHYLDCHTELPTFEVLGAAASIRATGGIPAAAAPADYERALAAVCGLAEGFARAGGPEKIGGGSSPSGRMFAAMTRNSRGARGAAVRMGAPAAVWALGKTLRRSFNLDLSPAAMVSAGLAAMRETVARLGIDADHVVFGHTHQGVHRSARPDGVPAGGPELHNTGSWVYSPGMLAPTAAQSLYWPGTLTWLEDTGPPAQRNLLADWDHARLRESAGRLQGAH